MILATVQSITIQMEVLLCLLYDIMTVLQYGYHKRTEGESFSVGTTIKIYIEVSIITCVYVGRGLVWFCLWYHVNISLRKTIYKAFGYKT